MKTKNTIWALIILIIIVLIGWYVLAQPSGDKIGTDNSLSQNGNQNTSETTNLKSLLAQGGNYTCTFQTIADNGQTIGTIYASASKSRLDLTVKDSAGLNTIAHIIRDGSTSYTWVDGTTTGFKAAIMPTSPIIPQPSGGVAITNDLVNISSDCHPWVPNDSEFITPNGITFVAQ